MARKSNIGFGTVKGPGGPRADKIKARLSDGEYVINAAAVKKVGVPMLDAINALGISGKTPKPKVAKDGAVKFRSGGFASGFMQGFGGMNDTLSKMDDAAQRNKMNDLQSKMVDLKLKEYEDAQTTKKALGDAAAPAATVEETSVNGNTSADASTSDFMQGQAQDYASMASDLKQESPDSTADTSVPTLAKKYGVSANGKAVGNAVYDSQDAATAAVDKYNSGDEVLKRQLPILRAENPIQAYTLEQSVKQSSRADETYNNQQKFYGGLQDLMKQYNMPVGNDANSTISGAVQANPSLLTDPKFMMQVGQLAVDTKQPNYLDWLTRAHTAQKEGGLDALKALLFEKNKDKALQLFNASGNIQIKSLDQNKDGKTWTATMPNGSTSQINPVEMYQMYTSPDFYFNKQHQDAQLGEQMRHDKATEGIAQKNADDKLALAQMKQELAKLKGVDGKGSAKLIDDVRQIVANNMKGGMMANVDPKMTQKMDKIIAATGQIIQEYGAQNKPLPNAADLYTMSVKRMKDSEMGLQTGNGAPSGGWSITQVK